MAVVVYIGLGSNLGDSLSTLQQAMTELATLPGCRLLHRSSLYRTAPVADLPQPDYLNAVVELETGFAPEEMLEALLAIESRHGRVRAAIDAPRTLDLDLLLYGNSVIGEPGLCVPHPRMHQRAFVLAPLVEIAPDCEIPGHGLARDRLSRLGAQRIAIFRS